MVADRFCDETRGDRRAVVVHDRDQPDGVDAVLVDDELAELAVAVLLDQEHELVLGDEIRHVLMEREGADAQLRSLIVNECGIDPLRIMPILHYDGTPITARFIARAIGESLDALKVAPLRVVS